jgi:hypothetical protein
MMNGRGVLFLILVAIGGIGALVDALKVDPIPFNDAVVAHYATVSEADGNVWNGLNDVLLGEEFNQTDADYTVRELVRRIEVADKAVHEIERPDGDAANRFLTSFERYLDWENKQVDLYKEAVALVAAAEDHTDLAFQEKLTALLEQAQSRDDEFEVKLQSAQRSYADEEDFTIMN